MSNGEDVKSIVLKVNGMSCGHCKAAVETALNKIDGVKDVSVDLAAKQVSIKYEASKVEIDQIKETIDNQGYEVV